MSNDLQSGIATINLLSENVGKIITEVVNNRLLGSLPQTIEEHEKFVDQEKYRINGVNITDQKLKLFDDSNSKLNKLPVYLENDIICESDGAKKSFGKISFKIQITYDLDDDATKIDK